MEQCNLVFALFMDGMQRKNCCDLDKYLIQDIYDHNLIAEKYNLLSLIQWFEYRNIIIPCKLNKNIIMRMIIRHNITIDLNTKINSPAISDGLEFELGGKHYYIYDNDKENNNVSCANFDTDELLVFETVDDFMQATEKNDFVLIKDI